MIPAEGMFSHKGNKELLESVKDLRLAKITSVNVKDMVAEIEFLGTSSGKSRVPLPMPSYYPGGGILSVPVKGAVVVIGIRAMQLPLILAYYPFNTFTPDSFFSIAQQTFGMPEALSEGDIYIRARANVARCDFCNKVSKVEEFEANIDPDTLVEKCPKCSAPSVELDENGAIKKLNKHQLGTTLHMRADGKIILQADNISSSSRGHNERTFKLVIDGQSGDVTLVDIGNLRIIAKEEAYIGCKKLTIRADDEIVETTANRTINTDDTVAETCLNKSIEAVDTLRFVANTLKLESAGFMNIKAKDRNILVTGKDSYNVGNIYVSTGASGEPTELEEDDGDRFYDIAGNDTENIKGNKTQAITGVWRSTIIGGVTLKISEGFETTVLSGGRVDVVTGDWVKTITGGYTISATTDIEITSAADTKINGTSVILNGGSLPVARNTDPTVVDATTDASFFTFLAALKTAIDDLKISFNAHSHAALGAPPIPLSTAPTPPVAPTAALGKITGGNATVKA